jgi:hypothetical protein
MAAPGGGCGRELRRPSGRWWGRDGPGGRRRRRASAAGCARAHAREMDRKCRRRSRCRVCRKHFHADPRAPTQKVCSAPCRLVWRHKHAKQRRALDLEGHRQADRARQQAWREARRAATGAPATSSRRVTPPSSEALSRAGFAAQPLGKKEEILLAWDKASQLSRASLERDLAKILGENASIVGQRGQGPGGCHAPGG